MWHSLWLGWLTIGEKLPSRPPRVYLNHKKPTLFKVWDHNLIALYLLFMICDQLPFHVVNVEPLVGKFLSFQKELIFFVPLPKLHVAIKRLDIDVTLVGRNIEDGLRLPWCQCRSNSVSTRWHLPLKFRRVFSVASSWALGRWTIRQHSLLSCFL